MPATDCSPQRSVSGRLIAYHAVAVLAKLVSSPALAMDWMLGAIPSSMRKVDARYTDVLARVVVDYGDTHESHYFAHSTSIAEDVLKRIFRRGALPLDERGHEGMVQ